MGGYREKKGEKRERSEKGCSIQIMPMIKDRSREGGEIAHERGMKTWGLHISKIGVHEYKYYDRECLITGRLLGSESKRIHQSDRKDAGRGRTGKRSR